MGMFVTAICHNSKAVFIGNPDKVARDVYNYARKHKLEERYMTKDDIKANMRKKAADLPTFAIVNTHSSNPLTLVLSQYIMATGRKKRSLARHINHLINR